MKLKLKQIIWSFFIGIICMYATCLADVKPDLPYSIPDEQFRPLRSLLDETFQTRLEKRLNQKKNWAALIAKKKMSVGVVDISDPHNVRFARVNGSEMMYAASLPKLGILLAASQCLEDGIIKETPEVLSDLNLMIRKSDNFAATRMIDRMGFEKIESVLEDPRYEFYDDDRGGGIWVGKRYAKKGRRHPDPIKGLSHGASATQVCRFYYLLSMGRLVNMERSKQMLTIMVDPKVNHKFVNVLYKLVPGAVLYRKSGTWKSWHSDSVLVWGPVWRRYIIVALVEDENGEQILRNLVPAVEDLLKPVKSTLK